MKRLSNIKLSAILAALCLMSGCSTAKTETITLSDGNTVELVIESVDEQYGVTTYKNPAVWSYDAICDALTIGGRKVEAPLTLEDFGSDYSLEMEIIDYNDRDKEIHAGLIFNQQKIGAVAITDCANTDYFADKKINMLALGLSPEENPVDFSDITINGITLGATREEVIAALGIPVDEVQSEGEVTGLHYKELPDKDSYSRSILIIVKENKVTNINFML